MVRSSSEDEVSIYRAQVRHVEKNVDLYLPNSFYLTKKKRIIPIFQNIMSIRVWGLNYYTPAKLEIRGLLSFQWSVKFGTFSNFHFCSDLNVSSGIPNLIALTFVSWFLTHYLGLISQNVGDGQAVLISETLKISLFY